MQITDLRTLHQHQPLGIDKTPYFSWKLLSDRQNVIQTAYRLWLNQGETMIWDSGRVETCQQSFVDYTGPALQSQTVYTWRVEVWNNYGESSQASSIFETAYLQPEDWQASWVESSIPRQPVTEYKYGNTAPAVTFEKRFDLRAAVRKARLYATAFGVYRLEINGRRPDDREFAPEFTVYKKILYYQTYDVTSLLEPGASHIRLTVGDGWFLSLQAGPVMDPRHDEAAVLFQLDVEYTDGTSERVMSDGNETCALGAIQYADIFQGEKQDLTVGPAASQPVLVKDYGTAMLKAQPMPPVRPMRLLPATAVFTSPAGETIVDFGQLLCGRARIHLEASYGTEVILEYFEQLDSQGNYYNSMFVPQKDIVVCNGQPTDYEAWFTFHGFRYIRVTGLASVRAGDFTAVLLTTEKENLTTFRCSEPRLNRLYDNIRWSQANNMMSIPTDCPSRERAGWTGDILIYARTALLNENVTPFLTSWLDNVRADQAEKGTVMITTPFTRLYDGLMRNVVKSFGDSEPTGVAGWSDAIVWVPWQMYQVTGNVLVLRENYAAMKRWCDNVIRTARDKRGNQGLPEEIDRYLWNTGFHFGEWLIPSLSADPGTGFEICKESSFYTAPFFGYQTTWLFSQIAALLDQPEAEYYADTADRMKCAIQKGLMYTGKLPGNLMGAYVLAFAFNLVPEDLRADYEARLLSLIEEYSGCLDTGFLATPFLLDVLADLGHPDLAHSLLWQNKQPSWLYEVEQGATAIWEHWNALDVEFGNRVVSFDHYAFGCVDDWISRKIAGINSIGPGFHNILICPESDDRLTWCARTFESEAGEIAVAWNKIQLTVTIPCNCTATVIWHGVETQIGSGRYTFV